jgi:hypothetical protein
MSASWACTALVASPGACISPLTCCRFRFGQVLAFYFTSGTSPGEVDCQIKALAERYKQHDVQLKHLWLDDKNLAGTFIAHFPSLAVPGAVKVDVLHVMMRYSRAMPSDWALAGMWRLGSGCGSGKHLCPCLAGVLSDKLQEVFFKLHKPDVALVQRHMREDEGKTGQQCVDHLRQHPG